MKKKILSLLVAGVMILGLAACGAPAAKPTNPPAPTPSGAPAPTAAPAGDKLTKETIKIGFIHIGDESDMGYTYNHVAGTKTMMENLGISEDQIVVKYNVPESSECETALTELIAAGCNIIFATSFGFEDYVLAAAAEHPEIQFCHATGYQAAGAGLPNLHNFFTAIYEARYLSGIAAGLKTKTNKLGYVGAFNFAEVISGYTAFYLGAKSVNPDVTMEVKYTDDWNNPTKEAQAAQSLIDDGCDVLAQHSDSTAVATAAQSNGVWQVGYNADMISAAPQASLISARVDWSVYYTYAVNALLEGTTIDTDWCEGFSDGAVYLSPLNDAIAAEGTAAAIEAAEAALVAGTLQVFAGPLHGVKVGGTDELNLKAGEFFEESKTQSAPYFDYIVDGIIEK